MNTTLRRPLIKTLLPGPKAKAILERDAAVMSTSYMRPYPFVPEMGQGVWLTDVDGNEFLDFMAGIAVSTTGYNHPHVVNAIREQSEKFMHVCLTDFAQDETTRLAERLVALAGGDYRVFMGNSGAEAVEASIKLARRHTKRPYMVAFTNSFHGRTYGAISLTGSKPDYRRGFEPLLPGIVHIPFPDPFRPPFGATAETAGQAVLEYLEKTLFKTILPPDEVAAIIIEPMQGEGGYVVPPVDFLPSLRRLCDLHGILLIFDEVQTGIGRSGKFFAAEHFTTKPDIILLAKGIASGLPISAMLARSELMSWPAGSHGSTFGGNPVAAAAANATIDLVLGEVGPSLMENANKIGTFLLENLRQMKEKYPRLGDVRGRGLFIGLEFVDSDGDAAPAFRDALSSRLFELGLLNLPCGTSAIRLSPPLIVNQEEANVGLEIIERALADLH